MPTRTAHEIIDQAIRENRCRADTAKEAAETLRQMFGETFAKDIEHRSLLLRERQAVADQMITSADVRHSFKLRQRLETIEQEIAQVNQSLESNSEGANSP
jgi:hypothetical protein